MTPLGLIPSLVLVVAAPHAPPSDETEATSIDTEPAVTNGASGLDPTPSAQDPAVPPEPEPKVAWAERSAAARAAAFEGFVDLAATTAVEQRAAFCDDSKAVETEGTSLAQASEAERRRDRKLAYFGNNQSAGANAVLDGGGQSTGAERLAGAINTKVDGVEAGIIVSPLGLLPEADTKFPPGWTLLLAALKDGKTRVGTGLGGTVTSDQTPTDLVRSLSCPDDVSKRDIAVREAALAAAMSMEPHYSTVCSEIVPHAADDAKLKRNLVERVRRICDPTQPAEIQVVALLDTLARLEEDATNAGRFRVAMATYDDAIEKLRSAQKSLTDLAPGTQDVDSILQGVRQARYSGLTARLGGEVAFDLNRRQFGFSPLKPTEPGMPGARDDLPAGDLLAARAGVSALFKQRRLELLFVLSGGVGKVVGDDKLRGFVEPTTGITYLMSFFDGRRVNRKRADAEVLPEERLSSMSRAELREYRRSTRTRYGERVPKFGDDGELPPRWVIGVRGTVQVPFSDLEFQRDPINSASILVHTDFIVSEKLKFRIGVPLTAELVEQEEDLDSDPDIPKETGILWSLPVFGTTVLAF